MCSDHETKYTLNGLVAILELSDRYLIPSGIKFACRKLEAHPSFSNALRIKLSRVVRTERSEDWFKTAVRVYLQQPTEELTEQDSSAMGGNFCRAVLAHKRSIELRRQQELFDTPHFYASDSCSAPLQCYGSWVRTWNVIRSRCSETCLESIFNSVEDGFDRGDVCIECYRQTVLYVHAGTSASYFASLDEKFVSQALDILYREFM